MMQATIVALYGKKPDDLSAILAECQNAVVKILGTRFRKYEIDQIHGTVIGLERDEDAPGRFLNRNFKTHRKAEAVMDFRGLLNFFQDGGHFPFQLQIGGFQDRDYPFTSRNVRPFKRCFSLQEKNVVVMGWPLRGLPLTNAPSSPISLIQETRLYQITLDSIRRGAQRYGVLHAYHAKPEDTDNDFFFRIGMVDDPSSVDSFLKRHLHNVMRNSFATLQPMIVNIELADLYVAFYESEELPLTTTKRYSLVDTKLDEDFIRMNF